MRPYATMGLDWLLSKRTSPSALTMGALQTMFLFAAPPHATGRFFAELIPKPVGPRQCDQFSAGARLGRSMETTSARPGKIERVAKATVNLKVGRKIQLLPSVYELF